MGKHGAGVSLKRHNKGTTMPFMVRQWVLLTLGISLGMVMNQFYHSLSVTPASTTAPGESYYFSSLSSSSSSSIDPADLSTFRQYASSNQYKLQHKNVDNTNHYRSKRTVVDQKKLPDNHHLLHSGRLDLDEFTNHYEDEEQDKEENKRYKKERRSDRSRHRRELERQTHSQDERHLTIRHNSLDGDDADGRTEDEVAPLRSRKLDEEKAARKRRKALRVSDTKSSRIEQGEKVIDKVKKLLEEKRRSKKRRNSIDREERNANAMGEVSFKLPEKQDEEIHSKDNEVDQKEVNLKKAKLIQQLHHINSIHANKTTTNKRVSPADYYLHGNTIVGDVSHLLDFAILGFSKTATSYLKDWLRQQTSHISISSLEVCYLNKKQGSNLIHHLVDTLDETKLRGFKCPSHFTRPSLEWYRQYFPRTKLIVGLRHPVSWFESFYNFRIRHPKYPNNATIQLPPPAELIGRCRLESQGLCTYNAQFHRQLARMARTPLNATERAMLHLDRSDLLGLGSHRVDNPVFVYEITQIRQNAAQFAADMATFLGLPQPLKPFLEKKVSSRALQEQAEKKKAIQICEPQYDAIRQELMQISIEASDWILGYFMPQVTITTSPTSSFVKAIQAWKQDPCEAKKKVAKAAVAETTTTSTV
ncbi:hypothetical protein ACA910_021980 [Epithemia clementina (nom. ined.)]